MDLGNARISHALGEVVELLGEMRTVFVGEGLVAAITFELESRLSICV